VLACEDIAREIQVQLDFLASENPDLAERHRSMQVVFDTSWRLLSNAEREVFPKLAVFRDSFSLDAVRSVTHTSLTILASLIDKSLLWKLPSGRYELHELVRQYAEQHLMAAGQHDMTLEAHCHYYGQFMAQCMEGLKAHQQIETLNRIDQDFENIRQAWYWAIDHQLLEQLNVMLEGLDLYCQMRNRFEDKASLFASALEQLDQTDNPAVAATRVRLILRSPSLYLDEVHHILESGMLDQSPLDRAYALYLIGINRPDDDAWFDESIVLFRELKEHYYLSRILDHYAFRHMMRGDHVTAKALFSESLALCMAHGNIFSEGRVVANMGTLAHASNDLPGFERYSDAAYQICVKINDWLGALYARANYILVRVLQYGQVTRAIHQLNELMTVVDDIAHPGARGRILLYRGFFQSDLLEAWRDFEVSQPHVADHPILRHATHLGLANVHGYQGDLLISKQHLITAYRGYQRDFEVVTLAAGTLLLVAHYYCHQQQFDDARIALALALTHYPEHLGYIDEIPYTRALVETIRTTAGPAIFEKALKDSRTRNPEVFLEDCIQRYEAELADRFQPVYEQAHHANQLLVEPLTRREIEIVYLVAQGMRNRDIAEELVVAEDTIKKHLTHIFGKLNVSSRSQLIKKAQSLKLL
ncbi:MAG: LuxR C-terminal-related transcriptional regulator, partial [Chloroflexi bacterium]|nr:LuxR C-terminal-related transcriptional regulator [Chloroflexota bacterium]